MVMQTATIARNTFVESIRQPVYMIIILLCGVLLFFTTWGTGFSMGYSSSAEVSGDNKLLLDVGLATVFVCGMLLSAFVSTAAVSREIENKTVLTVVSKPISRTSVVIGKYLGVAGAMLLAVLPMLIFLLMGIRHGVMTTAADDPDMPVIVFTFTAVLLALGLAAWCNFFYGWPFTQTVILVMVPALIVAYLLVLIFGKEWKLQVGMLPVAVQHDRIADGAGITELKFTLPTQDFKPQILLASGALAMSMMVLSAVAVAASTRLGQVMTLIICSGVFVFGLLSNYMLGRHAYQNERISVIQTAEPLHDAEASFKGRGDSYEISLKWPPTRPVRVGASFYYGESPGGADLAVPAFRPFEGDAGDSTALMAAGVDPGVVVTSVQSPTAFTIRNVGPRPARVSRAPRAGDHVFFRPTKIRALPLAVWSAFPNMQNFWLVDAVTQNSPIPPAHLLKVALYGGGQVVALLALAVILFQRRDVG